MNLISNNNNYLRKWKILVSATVDGKNFSYDLSDLRCTFHVKSQCTSPMTECSLEVYNLNNTTANKLLKSSFNVQLFAGYQNSRYGKIFDGDVVQSFRNYHDGVDDILQILALSGNRLLSNNWISTSLTSGQTQNQVLDSVAKDKNVSIKKSQEVQSKLSEKQYPRGQVIFKEIADIVESTASEINSVCQITKDGILEMKSMMEAVRGQLMPLNLNYTNGLIGSPVYSEQGITITSLLDSRIKPLYLIKVNNQLLERSYGNVNQIGIVEQDRRLIDPDGEYRIMSVTHTGDTYGDTWQTEAIGVGRNRTIKDMAVVL